MFSSNAVAAEGCIKEPEKYLVFKGNEAEDGKTGLIWKRCAVGMDWDQAKNTCADRPEYIKQQTAKEAAAVAGQGWAGRRERNWKPLLFPLATV